jgi:hypothetical protein
MPGIVIQIGEGGGDEAADAGTKGRPGGSDGAMKICGRNKQALDGFAAGCEAVAFAPP